MNKKRQYDYQSINAQQEALDDWYDGQQGVSAQHSQEGTAGTLNGPTIEYTVPRDTTLFRLAEQFGVSPSLLWKMNAWYFGLKSDFGVSAGTVLHVPDPKAQDAASTEVDQAKKDSPANASVISRVKGNEAGTIKGISSGILKSASQFMIPSLKVKSEGKPFPRLQSSPQQQPQSNPQPAQPVNGDNQQQESTPQLRGGGNDQSFYEAATADENKQAPQEGATVQPSEPASVSWPPIDLPPPLERGDIQWNTPLTGSIEKKYKWAEVMQRFRETSPLGQQGLSQPTLNQWVMKNLAAGWTSDMPAPSIFEVIVLPEKQPYGDGYYYAIEAFSFDDAFIEAGRSLALVPNAGQGFLWKHKNSGTLEYSGYGFSVHAAEGMENYRINKGTKIDYNKLGTYGNDAFHAEKVKQLTTFKAQMYSDDFYELVCSVQRVLSTQPGSKVVVNGIYNSATATELDAYIVNINKPKPTVTVGTVTVSSSSKEDSRAVLYAKLYYICGDLDLYQKAMTEEEALTKQYPNGRPFLLTPPAYAKLAAAASQVLFWNQPDHPLPPADQFFTAVDDWGTTFKGDEYNMDLARVSRLAEIEYNSYAGLRSTLQAKLQKSLQDYQNAEYSGDQMMAGIGSSGAEYELRKIDRPALYPHYNHLQTSGATFTHWSSVPSGEQAGWSASEFPLINPFDPKGEKMKAQRPWLTTHYSPIASVALTQHDQFIQSISESQKAHSDMVAMSAQTVSGNYDDIQTALLARRTKMGLELNKKAGAEGNPVVKMWAEIQKAHGIYEATPGFHAGGLSVNAPLTETKKDNTRVYTTAALQSGNVKAVSNIYYALPSAAKNDPPDPHEAVLLALKPFIGYMLSVGYARNLPAMYADETRTYYSMDALVSIANELYDQYTFAAFPQKDLVPQQMAEMEETARRLKETKALYGDMHVLPARFLFRQGTDEKVTTSGLSQERKDAARHGASLPMYWSKTGKDSYQLVVDLGDHFIKKTFTRAAPASTGNSLYDVSFTVNNGEQEDPSLSLLTPEQRKQSEQVTDSLAIENLIGQLTGYDLPEGSLTYLTPDGTKKDRDFEKPWDIARVLGILALVALAVAVPAALAIEGALVGSTIMATAGSISTGLMLGSIAAGLVQKEMAGTATGFDYAIAGLNALTALMPFLKLGSAGRAPIAGATGQLSVLNGKVFGVVMATGAVVNGFVLGVQFLEEYDRISLLPDGPEKTAALRNLMISSLLMGTLTWMQFKMGVKMYKESGGGYVDENVLVKKDNAGMNMSIARFNAGGEKLFDQTKLNRIVSNLQKEGVEVITGSKAIKILKAEQARAAYDPNTHGAGKPGTLYFGNNPTETEVIEELLHLGQHRKTGWAEATRHQMLKWEVEAQDILLNIGQKRAWTAAELEDIQFAQDYWNGKLLDYLINPKK